MGKWRKIKYKELGDTMKTKEVIAKAKQVEEDQKKTTK